MTVISSILNFIANKIGNISMGTTATTLTGAIAEVNAKTSTVQTASWSDIQPQSSATNVLAEFTCEPGKYLIFAKISNSLTDVVRVSMAIRSYSGTTTASFDGDANGYSGRNNWTNCCAYYEFTTTGTVKVTSYGKVGTDPVLVGSAMCVKLV